MRTIKRNIVGAFLFSNDEHLLIGKNVKGGVYEDVWVIPGGGIDDGETKLEAVTRETMEEVGIDISGADITLLPDVLTGTAEKTLRETGERVYVDMTFYNFRIDINLPASDLPFILTDDFGVAEWVVFSELKNRTYSPSVKSILENLRLI